MSSGIKRHHSNVAVKKTGKHRRGLYINLEDVIDAFSVYANSSGWVLHKYEGWICFAIHSSEFEDPDIKVIVKTNLEYKVIVAGLLLDTRLPSLAKNELKTVLAFAEKSFNNICCGLSEVTDANKFSIVHRRYSYDVFETPAETPRYQTVYRSPHCAGQAANGPCLFCKRLNEVVDLSPSKRDVSEVKNDLPNATETKNLTPEKPVVENEQFLQNGVEVLKENHFKANAILDECKS